MNPYAEIVEIEGELSELGVLTDQSGYGAMVDTENGPLGIIGMTDDDVDRLLPGICGRVRITIEFIDDDTA